VQAARVHRAPVRTCWRVDETYLKIGGRWRYSIGRSTNRVKSSMST
jgi:transposase-like protein